MSNIFTSSSSTSSITWSPTFSSNAANSGTIGTLTNSSYGLSWALKRCRECKHAHAEVGKDGCYNIDLNGNFTFEDCDCKEYIPLDNLEYLEYLGKKKDNK